MALGFRNPFKALRYGFAAVFNAGIVASPGLTILIGTCIYITGIENIRTDIENLGVIKATTTMYLQSLKSDQALTIAASVIAGIFLFYSAILSLLYAATIATTDARGRNEIGARQSGWFTVARRSLPLAFELGFIVLIGLITGAITFLGIWQVCQMIFGSASIPLVFQIISFSFGAIVGLVSFLGIIPYIASSAAEITTDYWRRGD